jgi:putative membrane protein
MNFFKDILRGAMIGVANIIPGVSGGTMMVSMGVYDKIIWAINHIFKEFKSSVKTLLPYGIGMLASIAGLSFCITYFFERFPLPTAFLFIGLIFGGLPVIFGGLKGKKANAGAVLLFVVFFALVILLQIFGGDRGVERELAVNAGEMGILLIMGVITSATMIIPGVSGSMVLMALGYYTPIIAQIRLFIESLTAFDIDGLLKGFAILIPFGIGVLAGILLVARLIEFLLKRYPLYTYSGILGLVIASPVAVLMGIGVGAVSVSAVIVSAFTFAIGFVAAFFLSK